MSNPTNKTPDEVAQEIVRLYARGVPVREISGLVGRSDRTVGRIVKEAGMLNRWKRLPIPDDVLTRAREMLEDGASYAEVARTVGVTNHRLERALPGYGWTKKQTWEFIHDVRKTKKVLK